MLLRVFAHSSFAQYTNLPFYLFSFHTGGESLPRLDINNFAVDYMETGAGLPIIFIPGISEFKEVFVFQFGGLQDSFRIVSYDVRRGLKRSADYTLDLLVEDLKGLMKALDMRSAVICGHSFGGLIAMEFAVRYPEQTRALILVSAFSSPPDMSPEALLGHISAAEHPLKTSVVTKVRAFAERLLGKQSSSSLVMEHQVEAVLDVARQASGTSKTTIQQRLGIIKGTDLRPNLPKIVAPTLVVAGAKDKAFFLASAQGMYERIPDATLEVIEGVGHFCFLTRHDQFNSAVDDFLTDRLAQL
jgi:pimeloyl-ACP methyl ester carboxylesterase